MYLIFRSKDEWSWAGNETWIRRKGNLHKHWRKGHGNGFKQLWVIWNLSYPGNQIGFLHGQQLLLWWCHEIYEAAQWAPCLQAQREAGPSAGRTCVFCRVPTLTGLWFLVPLVDPPSARWLPDWKVLALIHLRRCWCLLTGTSFPLCPLNWAGHSPQGRGRRARRSRGKRGSITLCKFSIQQSAMQQVRSLEELSSIQANW